MSDEFITLDSAEFNKRLIVVTYGRAGVGKTTMLYNAAKQGAIVYLISTDRGTIEAYLDKEKLKKNIAIAYPKVTKERSYLQCMRDIIGNTGERVAKIIASKKIDPSKIWVAVDTVTQLQQDLITESRKMDIKNPNSRANREEFVRDMTTQVDYNINLAQMNEVVTSLMDLPCNVFLTAYEKEEKDPAKANRSNFRPQISGQSRDRIEGSAEIICRLTIGEKGERYLQCDPTTTIYAKNRGGKLANIEPPDLIAMWNKVFAEPKPAQETK